MPTHGIQELNELFNEAEQADQDLFAEQRSNILLISGDHYTKKTSRFWNRIRDSRELSNEQKLRLTKNHTQKIVKTYINNILTHAPTTGFSAKNESELSDQKSAELNQAVWLDYKIRNHFKQKTREFASDFCGIGEVACKIFFDPMAGRFKGYMPEIDPLTGQPVLDSEGQMRSNGEPVFIGDVVCERVFGFNLLRHPDSKSMYDHSCKIIRKMVDIKDALSRLPDTDEFEQKRKWIKASGKDETFRVFDSISGSYSEAKNQVLFREFYYPPCPQYPMGYYFITVKEGIIYEGELPFGIFPVKFAAFDEIPTTPRGRSIVKQLRPYQAEVNRAASKMAEHQITLGDDKVLYQQGAKISQGGVLPGVRGIQYTGATPTILEGRSGEQYLNYMNSQIEEMYRVANVFEDMEEKQSGQMDPYAMMFKSIRQKKKFVTYSDKFEEFLIDTTETIMDLAKHYYPDDMVIPAIGKNEQVNIEEFRNTTPLQYQVKIEGQSEDVESKMGRQLVLNQVLQYVGGNLSKEDLGKLIRNMPYANTGVGLEDLTLNYDVASNIILALDRGKLPAPLPYQDHKYIIQRLGARISQADFQFLHPKIQQNYQIVMQAHQQLEAQELQALKQAESELIPTGGYLVACDFYVTDPNRPGRTTRARVPYESISWLMKQLEAQGMGMETLQNMQQGAQAQIASQFVESQGGMGSSFPTELEGAPPNIK